MLNAIKLFQLEDRKGSKFILSPTHEEEITSLVKDFVHSYRDLPLRLYQISKFALHFGGCVLIR